MRLSQRVSPSKCFLALLLVMQLAAPGWTQAQIMDYSKPRSHFPNLVAPYGPRHVPDPSFTNAPRIDQLIKNGKLMLSLSDAIAMALENNLDLAIARYNLSIADTDILRAKAGSSVRGVATGIVQGTPGGGVGGFGTGATGAAAGGTTAAAGGAGTGISGLVSSTLGVGPPVDSYDPLLSTGMNIEHASLPLASTFSTGSVPFLQQNTGTANFQYFQGFHTGTAMTVTFNNQRLAANNLRSVLNPDVSSAFRLNLRQHLLSGLSLVTNTRFIRIALNNREISDVAFRGQVIATVVQIENIYWDLVNAYEDVRVKERSLGLAGKTLSDNRKQVEIGTLAPIEITRADSEASTRQQDLIVSQTNLQLQQLLMKNAISRNLTDPVLAAAPVIPTDIMQLPAQEPVIPIQDLVNDALNHRWELAQARIDLTNRKINEKSARNGLLPTVDLVAWYGNGGLAGMQSASATCATAICTATETLEGKIPPGTIARGGFYNSFAQLFRQDFPDYGVGINVNIPIRNRSAQADQVRSELEYRQAQMRLQQLQNQISIEVRNAQFALQQNRARVEAARKGQELGAQSLDAEQKKYALGASTNFLVLQAQRDMAVAESNVVAATAAYEKSRVELDRATGLTLTRNGIVMGEAESGKVEKLPSVPGVVPRPDVPTPPSTTPPPPPGEGASGESSSASPSSN